MNEKEAWDTIKYEKCGECEFNENCILWGCAYFVALYALNQWYYAKGGSRNEKDNAIPVATEQLD